MGSAANQMLRRRQLALKQFKAISIGLSIGKGSENCTPPPRAPELSLALLVRRAVDCGENAVGLGAALHVALQVQVDYQLHRGK